MSRTHSSPAIQQTQFEFATMDGFYKGKVRDLYYFDDRVAMVSTDRISAFDHILPAPIPYKGQVLNGIAVYFLEATRQIVPNWLEAAPHPNVLIGKYCEPIRIEMVVRGYLTGHAWRTYKAGHRILCGVRLPEGMREHDRFETPIITPATKAEEGHDEDISKADILKRQITSPAIYEQLEKYALALFETGTRMAAERGLILVDTKYEFGMFEEEVYLIDEVHTPDSSRYFYAEGYEERQEQGQAQAQLSKEFVREWLMMQGFQGREGETMPDMPEVFVQQVSRRYIELYEQLTGQQFVPESSSSLIEDIEQHIKQYFA